MKKNIHFFKNSKGFFSLEFLIGILMFVATLLFAMDLIIIGLQRYQVHHILNSYARVIKTQSGTELTIPQGFYGTNGTYSTPSELLALITNHLNSSGINTENLEIWISGFDEEGNEVTYTLNSQSGVRLGYRTTFVLGIRCDIEWRLIGNVIPGANLRNRYNLKVTGVTEFKHDYDSWEAEPNLLSQEGL